MDEQGVLDKRITELELKAVYADDLLDRLNQQIYRQQQQIDALARELLSLRSQHAADGQAGPRNLQDERPPHY